MAEEVPAVSDVLDAIERRPVGSAGAADPPPAPPAYHEGSDGLITRWIDIPG